MNNLNLDLIGDYSGVGAETPMTGFGGTSGFGSANPNTGGGMFSSIGNFLNSNFASNIGGPLLSAGLSGILTNRAADNYGRSAREAALLGGQAALLAGREGAAFSMLGEDLAQKRRQDDALFQLNMQKSKPFQDLVTKSYGMQIAAQDRPGAEARAGRFMTMFG